MKRDSNSYIFSLYGAGGVGGCAVGSGGDGVEAAQQERNAKTEKRLQILSAIGVADDVEAQG